MPGLVGMISDRSPRESQQLVEAMLSSMQHESFYTSGLFAEPAMGFHLGWIALENSLSANQPFYNERRDVILLLAGECFIDPPQIAQLKARAHDVGNYTGDSLVHLYEEQGDRFFENLNGLFSGILIDKRKRKAFLFNDRYGLERIYFHETDDALYFASEAKALLRVLPQLRQFDPEGVAQFLTFGCTLEWKTLFRGVQVLPGGSLWTFEEGNYRKGTYFSPETWESLPTLSVDSFEASFQETFRRILPRYFEADSELGISLTAGLDTRMIMACRPEQRQEPVCYTFAGTNQRMLDATLAARVADCCNLPHQALRIEADFLSDFASQVDQTVFRTDGCFGVLGAHEIYLNRKARQLAPVRVTGNFGGEILRGVSTFNPIGLAPQLVNPEMNRKMSSVLRQTDYCDERPVTFAAFCEIPWNLFGTLAAGRSQVNLRTPYLDNEIVALGYQAPESSRLSPTAALNLIKANKPSLCGIPTDRGLMGESTKVGAAFKRVFSEMTFKLDYYHNEGLPHMMSRFDPLFKKTSSALGVVGLHKYLHYRSWFRSELADYLTGAMLDTSRKNSEFWDPEFIERMAQEHIGGHKNYVLEINAVLTLEAVDRLLFRNLPREIEKVDGVELRSASAALG